MGTPRVLSNPFPPSPRPCALTRREAVVKENVLFILLNDIQGHKIAWKGIEKTSVQIRVFSKAVKHAKKVPYKQTSVCASQLATDMQNIDIYLEEKSAKEIADTIFTNFCGDSSLE